MKCEACQVEEGWVYHHWYKDCEYHEKLLCHSCNMILKSLFNYYSSKTPSWIEQLTFLINWLDKRHQYKSVYRKWYFNRPGERSKVDQARERIKSGEIKDIPLRELLDMRKGVSFWKKNPKIPNYLCKVSRTRP